MGSTSWTGSGKDMKTKSTKEKCKSRKESVEDLSGKRLLNHNALCGVKELVSFASLWCEMYLEHSYLNQFWPPLPLSRSQCSKYTDCHNSPPVFSKFILDLPSLFKSNLLGIIPKMLKALMFIGRLPWKYQMSSKI